MILDLRLVSVSLSICLVLSSQNFCLGQNYAPQSYNHQGGFAGGSPNSYYSGGFGGMNSQGIPANSYGQSASRTQNVSSVNASGTTMNQLEAQLNAIDTRQGWAQTPVSATGVGAGAASRSPTRKQVRMAAPAPGNLANNMQGMFPGVSRQEMMRVFFEGGSPQAGAGGGFSGAMGSTPSSSSSSANVSTAYSNNQQAQNEATKARNYANTARYDKNKWNRKNAATQAEYAANNANYAAQRAEAAAYSGDSQARGYANLARQAANRARASANQARYNADTIQ